ncbi:MAG: YvcK family protein [bacterium]|nr:YvcK family protein [bacterium]
MKQTVTIVGGGTGSFIVLSGLKYYPVELNAVVTVSDDGGSTGRLRDEFGFLPVGDLRQCIAALADDDQDGYLTKLLLYRFEKGKGLKGHNLGNLILTALSDIYGSEVEALEVVNKIFHLKGKVLPVSLKPVRLGAVYSSGKTIVSEHLIEEYKPKDGELISKLFTKPPTKINPRVKQAIAASDFIILGPGDLYGSTIANLVIDGVPEALRNSRAKLIMIVNLMTLRSQTHKMTASDHVRILESYLGKKVDCILMNNQTIPKSIRRAYAKEEEFPVADDLNKDKRVIRRPLLAESRFTKSKSDKLKRSFLRHDPDKVAWEIMEIINKSKGKSQKSKAKVELS